MKSRNRPDNGASAKAASLEADTETLAAYFEKSWKLVQRDPIGSLQHPWLEPGAGYHDNLWDWDAFFCGIALAAEGRGKEHLLGSARNLIRFQARDGSIPYVVAGGQAPSAETNLRDPDTARNSCKPVLAQMILRGGGDALPVEELPPVTEALEAHAQHWESTEQTRHGLFTWRTHRGSGTDNHPGVYGRPANSAAGVDLNCFWVREYEAMAALQEQTGDVAGAARNRGKARTLSDAINRHLWDPVDAFYYHADVQSREIENVNQPVTWVVPMKYRAWTGFMPLWAGVASPDRAEALVDHLCNEAEFRAPAGLRTLARCEPLYNMDRRGNPSNWQGPVWIVASYLVFRGLLDYGYLDEARQLTERTVALLAKDVRQNACLHEYYNPETGEGLMNPGFLNWNFLGLTMARELAAATPSEPTEDSR